MAPRSKILFLALLAALASGCATTPQPAAPAVEAQPAVTYDFRPLQNPKPGFQLQLWSDQRTAIIGDQLALKYRSGANVFVSLYEIGSSGSVGELLENRPLKHGEALSFPAPEGDYAYNFAPPPGVEHFVLVATTEPLNWVAPADRGEVIGPLTKLRFTPSELIDRLGKVLHRQHGYNWNSALLKLPLQRAWRVK